MIRINVNEKIKKIDFFIPALLLVIIIAKILPKPAVYDGYVNLKLISDIGISIVFLFYGIKLNINKLKADIKNWKLHIVIQLTTFVLFPLIVLPFVMLFKGNDTWLLWVGGFFLASLPSTVSSSVILVSIAKGNVPSAIFNATFSSLAGIVITPLLMGLIIHSGQGAGAEEFINIVIKLFLQVLLPIIVGISLNRYFGKWAEKKSNFIKRFDQSIILMIVYISFAKSFYTNQFQLVGIIDLLVTAILCLLLLFVVYQIITYSCHLLKFRREETITAQFAGSQKSIIHGTVMSNVIFGGIAGVGIILLPLMIYHSAQLIIMGIMAQRKTSR